MKHELDQEQVGIAETALDRLTRSRALSAAVAFHAARTDIVGRTASAYDVLGTAKQFEMYLRNGKVNGNG